jgi:two-component system, LytTR family, response regulator
MKFRALIIDDEYLARDIIKVWSELHPEIEIIGECRNGKEAINNILSFKPDLIFLDIQMPDVNGFGVIEAISNVYIPEIVFVTAYDKYALQAFEVSATDYLLKPFTLERFDRAVSNAIKRIGNKSLPEIDAKLKSLVEGYLHTQESGTDSINQNILIKTKKKIVVLSRNDIDWVQVNGDYIKIHSKGETQITKESLSKFEELLGNKNFVRIHRSMIVNVDRIKELHPYFNGEYFLVLYNGTKLKLSRTYKDKFIQRFGKSFSLE